MLTQKKSLFFEQPKHFETIGLDEFANIVDRTLFFTSLSDEDGSPLIHEGITPEGKTFYSIQSDASDRITLIYPDASTANASLLLAMNTALPSPT